MILLRLSNTFIRPALLLVALLLLAPSVHARAADAACAKSPPSAAAAMAPASADIVLVIDRAADIAVAPRGRAALRVLQEIGLFADSAIAWNELAAALGMTPDAALRAIAGERVMLIIRTESVERPAAWALITHVAPRTERLVRERLKPVPKHIAAGQPVLMLENGRFLLATRADRAQRAHAGGGGSLGGEAALLIASAHASDLFDACLPLLAGKPAADPISADPLASLACAPDAPVLPGNTPDGFILYRPRTSAEPDAPRTLLTISCSRSPDFDVGWSATIACAPNFLGAPDAVARRGTSEALFRAVSDNAILAFAAPVSSTRDAGSGFARILFRFMSDVAPLFEGPGLVALRERPAVADAAPALELLVGTALTADADVKSRFDDGMSALINRLTREDAALIEAHDFDGRFPAAVREADLSPRSLSLLGPMIGPAPVARWCFADPDRDQDPNWWLAQITTRAPGSDGSALRAVAATLTPDPELGGGVSGVTGGGGSGGVGTPTVAYTTIGLIRPDAMHRLFPPVIRTITPLLAPLRWAQSIEWRATLHADGLVRGTASIRFLPEAADPAERPAEGAPVRLNSR